MTTPSQPGGTPSSPAPAGVTELLLAWGGGDRGALDSLLPLVYEELRRQAARALRREGPEHTLQATALVHEAYFRLVEQDRVQWKNRAQFFGIAAQLIRRILIDHARARHAAKRVVFHFTPLRGSWLDQIEIWFSILSRKLLLLESFTSITDLQTKVFAFINYYNRYLARPFRWTYTGATCRT